MNFESMATDLGLESEEFCELVEIFVESTVSDLEKLESALSSGEVEQVVEAAHSIKGAAGSLGFNDAQMLAKEIESNARENTLDGSIEAAVAIKNSVNAISEALKGI